MAVTSLGETGVAEEDSNLGGEGGLQASKGSGTCDCHLIGAKHKLKTFHNLSIKVILLRSVNSSVFEGFCLIYFFSIKGALFHPLQFV